MTNTYDAPFKEEILSYNGQPIAVFKAVNPDTQEIIIPKMALKLVSDVIQEANGITAPQLNNMNGEINSHSELIQTILLSAELKDAIRSTGNDNLELFGINEKTSIGVLNNHNDYATLNSDAVAGSSQLEIINVNGLAYIKSVTIGDLESGSISSYYYMEYSEYHKRIAVSGRYNSGGSRGVLVLYNDNGVRTNQSGTVNGSPRCYKIDVDSPTGWVFLFCSWYSVNTAYPVQGFKSNLSTTDETRPSISNSGTYGGGIWFNGYLWQWTTFGIVRYTVPTSVGSNLTATVYQYTDSTVSYTATYMDEVMIRSADNYICGSAADNYLYTGYNPLSLSQSVNLGFIAHSICNKSKIWVFADSTNVKVANSEFVTSSTSLTNANLDFLNGRTINSIKLIDGAFWMVGTGNLCAFSGNGIDWTETENILPNGQSVNFYDICKNTNTGEYVILSSNKLHFYNKVDISKMINKRYKINNQEFVTVTDLKIGTDTAILTLQNPLMNSYDAGLTINRTDYSKIQPNSTQSVCVEIQNRFSHNAAVAIPIFTKMDNVSVIAEICQRNENEIEEWVSFPFIKSLVSIDDWIKNTYFLIYPQQKDIFAMCFTVTNNNEDVVELFQLSIGLSDEVYEV